MGGAFLDEIEVEDEHAVFKDWEGFENVNIFDVSKWPLLSFLDTVFLNLAHPKRHIHRLACVISVAGHILKQSFRAPEDTNFYVLTLMPTCIGKNTFIHAIDALLEFFLCSSHIVKEIGTIQGLHKHLDTHEGKMFNKVDEISEYIRIMNGHRGNPHKDELKKAFKEIATGNPLSTPLIKGAESKIISNIYASFFWTGTEHCFKFLTLDDFRSGMMGRFLYFYTPEFADFGADSRELEKILKREIGKKDLENYHTTFPYEFKEEFIVSDACFELTNKFRALCSKKALALGKNDVRMPLSLIHI